MKGTDRQRRVSAVRSGLLVMGALVLFAAGLLLLFAPTAG